MEKYSALLSVYRKERVEYLKIAIDSLICQTIPPSEIVVVKDGELTDCLNTELERYNNKFPGLFRFVEYRNNRGLGYALRQGVTACSYNIISRMDTDDYAFPDRMELQLKAICDEGYDMVSSQVTEFLTSPDEPISRSDLPESYEDIRKYSKKRNPFRHPAMTFKKDKVLEAGNYNSKFPFFEDWDLFNRMLSVGCRACNLHRTLVAMRISNDFYARRGGREYLRYAWKFKYGQFQSGYFSLTELAATFLPQALVCLMPNQVRSYIYNTFLRKNA